MAKRKFTLTSQEMADINARIKTLESQLKHSNARVDELEGGLGDIDKLLQKKSRPKAADALRDATLELVNLTLNPPVTARVLREAAEAAEAAELAKHEAE
ncbi:MAG: septal ring factor EnvC (AmiA/AmiB activator) [Candidatus Azotimanducaceae bacterium]|jgi:septal ring factor EnvC (AmiA/AmiB activator)